MKTSLLALALGCCLTLSSSVQAATSLKIHGSATVYEMLMGSRKAEIEKECGLTLEVLSMGSGKGIESLVAGTCDVAMVSAPLVEIAEKLNAKKPGFINPADYQSSEVGRSEILFIVHPSNGIIELTVAQLKDLFVGKISNWKEVGGADSPVVVISPIAGHGVRVAVEHGLLTGSEISKTARTQQGSPQVMNAVAQIPGAVGFVGAGRVALPATVKKIGTDKTLPMVLLLVTKGVPNADAAKLIAAARKIGAN